MNADEKSINHLIDILIQYELDFVCEQMSDDYCAKHCKYDSPQRDCWKAYIEEKVLT